MCHQTVRPTPTGQSPASGDAPAAPAQTDAEPDPAAQQEGHQNQDNGTSQETQSDAATPDPSEQQEETISFEDGDFRTEDEDKPAETHREAVQGLRFSSSGDFVGFVSPVSSCSSGGDCSSHVLMGKTSPPNMHNNKGGESGENSPPPSTPNEYTVEDQSESNGAELEDSSTFCPRVPQNGDGCEGTPKSWNGFDSLESNNNFEASGGSLVDNQTSVKSCNENLELSDPPSHKGNGTYSDSDLDGLREAETVLQIPRVSSSDATFSCTSTNSDCQ